MMWSLLQLCYFSIIANCVLVWDLVFTKRAYVLSEAILANSFNNAYIGLDQLVHSIFAIKIWTVALKLREITTNEPD